MAIYDVIKDALSLAQKADNADLIKQLLEIGQQALDLQAENSELRGRIRELEEIHSIEKEMIRADEPFFVLKRDGEESKKYYCSTCWGKEKKLIQMWYDGERKVHCPLCGAGFSITPCKRKQMYY